MRDLKPYVGRCKAKTDQGKFCNVPLTFGQKYCKKHQQIYNRWGKVPPKWE